MESQTTRAAEAGQLFIVATPIGNLEDITFRAVRVLRECSLIAAEDTRISRRLAAKYGIETPMIALHEHNEEARTQSLIERLGRGERIALISDAGTPLVSDPGFVLVRAAIEAGIRVVPVPGPSSLLAALCASGLPALPFHFLGFPPRSGRARTHAFEAALRLPGTLIWLESPRRLARTLKDLAATLGGERPAVVARELTKLHEEFVRGTLDELATRFADREVRGEVVVLVGPGAGAAPAEAASDEAILAALNDPELAELPPSRRAARVARRFGVERSRVYRLLTDRK